MPPALPLLRRPLAQLLAWAALTLPVVAANASEDDPWERFNRPVFRFNHTVDTYALKPLAQGYQKVTPGFLRRGIHNMFLNLGEAVNLTNNLLQGKPRAAGIDTSRFLFNTTFGLLGFFDVGSKMGLPRSDEDFGQTLAVWGVGSGPYLLLPFLGPSTLRDAPAKLPDYFLTPGPYLEPETRFGLTTLNVIDTRVGLLSAEGMMEGDRYSFIRNVYLQNREYKIHDGEVEDDF
ncbi:hypothetical protein AXE65_04040 [Ventosimonas gracilis]|uniref:ABC transporter n=1 Tax=Ventosimonas gracilis TaxID=1680762 RepID=A0A139SRH1_9GAMM|nr:VacJ family lipoprotein [Ventosimonas gracilis]KXU37051.1 hypothetical protein AXE65_04040 [Ventosimonas gracilis]